MRNFLGSLHDCETCCFHLPSPFVIVELPGSTLWLWHFLGPFFDCVLTVPSISPWVWHFLRSAWLWYFLVLLYNCSWRSMTGKLPGAAFLDLSMIVILPVSFLWVWNSCVFSMTVKLPGASLWLRCDTSLGLSMTSWVLYDYGTSWGIFIIIVENILLITLTFDIFNV